MAAFSVLPSQHEATQLPGAALMQPAHRDDATQHAPAKGVPAWMSELHPADPGPRFDPLVAHPARVYAYWLGGKDHYLADRQAAEEVIRWRPQVVAGARANRAFLSRVVRYLAAERGIRQFLDIGTGLPAPGSTHQVAQAITPEARIVYVDNDPLVLVHARALLTSTQGGACDYLDADLRDTAAICAQAAKTLDFTQPAAILLLAILHFIPDTDDPHPLPGHGPVRRAAAGATGRGPGQRVAARHRSCGRPGRRHLRRSRPHPRGTDVSALTRVAQAIGHINPSYTHCGRYQWASGSGSTVATASLSGLRATRPL